jgi:hypothetical protein
MTDRVDRFLANVQHQGRRGNLIFALDATASREKTWDLACQLQGQMLREVATVGTLSMQLVHYRGVQDAGGECKASRWVEDPMEHAGLMSKIKCDAGQPQIACHQAQEARDPPCSRKASIQPRRSVSRRSPV